MATKKNKKKKSSDVPLGYQTPPGKWITSPVPQAAALARMDADAAERENLDPLVPIRVPQLRPVGRPQQGPTVTALAEGYRNTPLGAAVAAGGVQEPGFHSFEVEQYFQGPGGVGATQQPVQSQLLPSVQAQSPYVQDQYVQAQLQAQLPPRQSIEQNDIDAMEVGYGRAHGNVMPSRANRDAFDSLPMWRAMANTRAAGQAARTKGFWYGDKGALADNTARQRDVMRSLGITPGSDQVRDALPLLPESLDPDMDNSIQIAESQGGTEAVRIASLTHEGRKQLRLRGITPGRSTPRPTAVASARADARRTRQASDRQKRDERASLNYYKAQGIPATKAMLPALNALASGQDLSPDQQAAVFPEKVSTARAQERAVSASALAEATAAGLGSSFENVATGSLPLLQQQLGFEAPVSSIPIPAGVEDVVGPEELDRIKIAVASGDTAALEQILRPYGDSIPKAARDELFRATSPHATADNPSGGLWGRGKAFIGDNLKYLEPLPPLRRDSDPPDPLIFPPIRGPSAGKRQTQVPYQFPFTAR